jgi:hypothetical protein
VQEDQSKALLLLHSQHVFCSDDVRHPQILVVIFAVPAAVLRCEVLHIVKRITSEQLFHLSVVSDVSSDIVLAVSVEQVSCTHAVTALPQLVHQIRSYESGAARDEYCMRLYLITSSELYPAPCSFSTCVARTITVRTFVVRCSRLFPQQRTRIET